MGDLRQKFEGVIPPIPTPFTDGEVDASRLAENLERWNRFPLAGYLALGSNGEYVSLTPGERQRVIEVTREQTPPERVLLVGTGAESTPETIRLTREAAQLGADAALVVNPAYYKRELTRAVLEVHFLGVAEASPVPILLYNVPQYTGLSLEPELVEGLAQHPNIIGMKDSSGDLGRACEILTRTPAGFLFMVGAAPIFYPALCAGATGGILALANVAPGECCALYQAFRRGDHAEARRLHFQLLPVGQAVTSRFGIGGLKAALDLLGYYGGPPRPPLLPPSEAVRGELQAILQTAGLL